MVLKVKNLNANYGQMHVIRGIDLDVKTGQLISIFGSNGHGKSTFLKTISGLVPATKGSVIYKDQDITNLKPHQIVAKGITYIPEDRNIFRSMTVLENLKLGAYLPGARKKENKSLEMVLDLFPRLGERKKQIASTLSGGELRMLAVGRGLMTDADLLLIDEPSIGLSPLLKKEMYGVVDQIKSDLGKTIVLVEQEIKEAMRIADEVYLLKKGKFVYAGPKEKLDEKTIREAFL